MSNNEHKKKRMEKLKINSDQENYKKKRAEHRRLSRKKPNDLKECQIILTHSCCHQPCIQI